MRSRPPAEPVRSRPEDVALCEHGSTVMTPSLLPRSISEFAPGAIHVPDWLSIDEQGELVAACREWARAPAPMRTTRLLSGAMMSVQTVCLGWHWMPYRYSRVAEDVDGAPAKPFPGWLGDLGRRAVASAGLAGADGDAYDPDAALVNFYADTAKMGMHQDKDERSVAPVVSISLGASCVFRFGNTENRNRPFTDVELCSGDLVVFGGVSRLAFHGVPRILPGTGPVGIGLESGRLNVTLRVTGLDG
jgi:DNA oxidative demethylase